MNTKPKEWPQQNRANKIATGIFSNKSNIYKQVTIDADNNINLQNRAI